MSSLIGTRTKHFAGDAAIGLRTVVADNDSALIVGIVLAGTANDIVTFTAADGTVLLTLSILANATAVMNIPFITSDGFIASATLSTSFITVIYRPGV